MLYYNTNIWATNPVRPNFVATNEDQPYAPASAMKLHVQINSQACMHLAASRLAREPEDSRVINEALKKSQANHQENFLHIAERILEWSVKGTCLLGSWRAVPVDVEKFEPSNFSLKLQ